MSLGKLILIIAAALIILILIMFPEARALFKGFGRLFIKDMAQTPEGAEAIYTEKINQAQDSYNKADNALRLATGKLSNARKDLANKKDKVKKVEAECEALVKAGKIDSATIKSEEREELLSDIKRISGLINVYEEAEKTAKEAYNMCEKNLRKLKREKTEVVENMKVKNEMREVYDDINDLKNVTGTDKALDYVREKNRDLDAMVEGARVVHNSKASTKIQKAEAEAKSVSSNEYIESLKKKYSK